MPNAKSAAPAVAAAPAPTFPAVFSPRPVALIGLIALDVADETASLARAILPGAASASGASVLAASVLGSSAFLDAGLGSAR